MQQRSPATNFLAKLNKTIQYLDGHLSLEHGFFPATQPLREFPVSHQAWNEVIKRMPQEIQKPGFREFVLNIPLLSAESLPDKYLPLAATFFCIVSYAYCNFQTTPDKIKLPDNITTPWHEVSRRLGRTTLNMDGVDIFINNWIASLLLILWLE